MYIPCQQLCKVDSAVCTCQANTYVFKYSMLAIFIGTHRVHGYGLLKPTYHNYDSSPIRARFELES